MEIKPAETAYRVLARKYRPENFSDLIGQEPMVRTLTNAFETGRIAQAWMLTGVRGVGKTTTARILARALNYKTATIDRPTIDLKELGEHCQAIMEGRHVDVVEMDAASHTGIDDIREIIEQVRYRPVAARYKVYIIDEVHMLSTQAFNGLLKTLEEPPPHVKFIFATTEIRKVPITVLSRCQRFDLRRIESSELTAHLRKISASEKIEAEEKALAMIARAGEGSVRDALSILDQAIAHGDGKVDAEAVRSMLGMADRARIIDLFELIMKGDVSAALNEMRSKYNARADPLVILTELADFNHLVTRLRFTPHMAEDVSLAEEERVRGLEFSQKLSVRVLSRTWQMLLKGCQEVDHAARPIQAAEMLLIRLAHAADLPTLDETLKAIADGKMNGNINATPTSVQPSHQEERASEPAAALPIDDRFGPSLGDNQHLQQPFGQAKLETKQAVHTMQLVSQSSAKLKPQDQSLEAPALAEPRVEQQFNPDAQINQTQPTQTLRSLQDIVDLADRNNDLHFKLLVKEYVRPVSFQPGRIEFEPAEGTPRTLAHDMAKLLRDWTGERWAVSVVNQGGGATLREEDDSTRAALLSDAEADPDIAKILRHFPGSKIVDVRLNKQDDLNELDMDHDDYQDDNEGDEN